MNKILLIISTLLLCVFMTHAQYNTVQNSVWAMGNKVGLDFRGGGEPTVIATSLSGIDNEGCASVTGTDGKFLFYTNGNKIWDSTGAVMPNGGALPGYSSATQGALIVPLPNNPRKYYLFTLSYDNGYKSLHCSLVDMSLHNGLGDIDVTFNLNGSTIIDSLSEKMIAIRGCNKDVWVIVHANTVDNFYAFNVGVSGINLNPVVSSFPNYLLYAYGVIKGSPQGNRILVCTQGLKTYDFDGSTGIVSNPVMEDFDAYYGGDFSPDGSKVYALTFGYQTHLYQYDLSAASPAATKTLIDTIPVASNFSGWADMKLAPDGKIYFAPLTGSSNGMERINFPNLAGLACGLQTIVPATNFSSLGADHGVAMGLPNIVVTTGFGGTITKHVLLDTFICAFPYTQGLSITAPLGMAAYHWNDNTTNPVHTVFQSGTYWVRYSTGDCNFEIDTFILKAGLDTLAFTYANDTLQTTHDFATYQWYYQGQAMPGNHFRELRVNGTGWYSVVVSNSNGCSDSAAFYVGNVTGIHDVEAIRNQIVVSPNPTQGMVTVYAPIAVNLELVNIGGAQLLKSDSKNMDMTALTNGLYFLYIRDNEGHLITVRKIVKKDRNQ